MTEVSQEKAKEIFDEIATTLKNDGILHLYNPTLGEIEFSSGILGDLSREKNGGYGMKHIIQGRYEKDGLNVNQISSVLFLVKDIAERETNFVSENEHRGVFKSQGIQIIVSKKWHGEDGKWVITGYGVMDKSQNITKEASDAIQTVIAQYGYALEHSSVREQVGAVVASIKNIRQELEKVKGDESKMLENEKTEKIMTVRDFIENYEGKIDVRNDCVEGAIPFMSNNGKYRFTSEGLKEFEDVLDFKMTVKENEAVIHIPRQEDKLKEFDTLEHVGQLFVAISEHTSDKWFDDGINHAVEEVKPEFNSKEVDTAIGELIGDGFFKEVKNEMSEPYDRTIAGKDANGNTVVIAETKHINLYDKEETKMAELTKEQQIAELERKLQEMKSEVAQEQGLSGEAGVAEQQFGTIKDDLQQVPNNGGYVRKTEDILTKDALHNESMSRYGMVTKGWLMSAPSIYEIESKNGNFYRSQMLIGSQAPTSIVFDPARGSQKCQFSKDAHFEFVEMDTKTKPDFSRCEPGKNQEMIEFSGVKCEITQRDANGKSLGKTTERFFVKSTWVTQLDENKRPVLDREGKTVRAFISVKENSMDNLVDRTGREFTRGHYIENKHCFGFNREITDQQGVNHGYRHQICVASPMFVNGSRVVDEKGVPKATFKKFTWRTDEKLSDSAIEKIKTEKDLAIKYQKHIYRYKGQDNQWHTGRTNELVNLGCYLERDKTVEKDAAPNKTYEGVVEDFSRGGFNTRSESGEITAHRWEDLPEIADAAKIKLGEKVKLEYNKDMKISKVSQPEKSQAKTKQQDKGLSM